jgi:hypothetical protein
MKKTVFVFCALFLFTGIVSAKSLLEKTVFFFNPTTEKIDSATYWKVFLGSYSATVERKFPGDEPTKMTCDMNLTLLSSGYVEGYGYSKKGRIDCEAGIMGEAGNTPKKIALDSVEYIFNNGQEIKLKNGPVFNLFLDAESNKIILHKKMTLTKYRLQIIDDERNLKPAGDVNLTWFAFTKAGAVAAQKADKEAEAKSGQQ